MAARTPKLANAGVELGFVIAAGALGALAAPVWSLPLLAAAMIGYWIWNRRAGLAQLAAKGLGRLAAMAAISLLLIVIVLAGAYALGGFVKGVFA